MLEESSEKESIFKVNPSKPSRSNYIITDIYTSFEQIGSPAPKDQSKAHSFFNESHILNPSIWIALIILGLLTAFIGFTIDYLAEKLLKARFFLATSESPIGNFVIWILFSLTFAVIAASTGKFISTDAEGSGIPEVKSILSGVHMSNYLSINTLSAKVVGLIAGCAAGLSIGKEGPFVHISAIIANKLLKSKYLRNLPNVKFI